MFSISNCTISAYIPVAVRNQDQAAITNFIVAFKGTNTFTKLGTSAYHVAISNSDNEYGPSEQTPNKFADGVITVTGADASWAIYKQ